MNKKIMIVAGTRPEWIKLISFINESEIAGFNVKLVNTGQHLDMSKEVLDMFGQIPDYELKIMEHKQSLTKIIKNVINKLTPIVEKEQPDYIVVLGDTNTGMGAGLVAFYNQIPLIHLEGGARSYNKKDPFPEEMNRRLLDNIADYITCQTTLDQKLLEKENIHNSVFVGNYSLDVLKRLTNKIRDDKKVLITMHRREGWGDQQTEVCGAIKMLAEEFSEYTFVFPIHPNPSIQENVRKILTGIDNVKLIDALRFDYFIDELSTCSLVMTDSGGVLQEALFLKKPVIYLRDICEYAKICDKKMIRVTGKHAYKIVEETSILLSNKLPCVETTVFGDGNAGKKTVELVMGGLK